MLFLDVDHFKYVNDNFGHRAGDQLIVGVAGVLREVMRGFPGQLYRIGGDEFAIHIPESLRKESVQIAEKVLDAVRHYKFQPPGHLNMSSGEATSLFAAGHVAMQIEYFQRMTAIAMNPTKSKVHDRIDFSVLPSQVGVAGRPHAMHAGGNAVAIYSLSKNKAAAYKIMALAATRDRQKKVLTDKFPAGGWVPPRLSLLKDPEMIKRYPWMTKALNQLLLRRDVHYFQLGQIPEYFASIDILGSQIHRSLSGQATPEAAMTQAQAELEALFKRAGYIK